VAQLQALAIQGENDAVVPDHIATSQRVNTNLF